MHAVGADDCLCFAFLRLEFGVDDFHFRLHIDNRGVRDFRGDFRADFPVDFKLVVCAGVVYFRKFGGLVVYRRREKNESARVRREEVYDLSEPSLVHGARVGNAAAQLCFSDFCARFGGELVHINIVHPYHKNGYRFRFVKLRQNVAFHSVENAQADVARDSDVAEVDLHFGKARRVVEHYVLLVPAAFCNAVADHTGAVARSVDIRFLFLFRPELRNRRNGCDCRRKCDVFHKFYFAGSIAYLCVFGAASLRICSRIFSRSARISFSFGAYAR